MGYAKFIGVAEEYVGTSFSRTLVKEDGTNWDTNDTARYAIYDCNGNTVASGDLTKSDPATFTLLVSKTTTTGITPGDYLLIVYLENVSNPDVSDVIAEYRITWNAPASTGSTCA